jgi:hydrophobe/amphiphile efflux-1 (HAE1) family protein
MRLTHFFIDRPRFAIVLNTFVTLLGLGSLASLPVAQYPEVVPPTVQITTTYPGASAETVARTVATPLEQEINGVENMLYMSSQSTGDGNLTITVTFRIGTDLNVAQMLTQNRVQDVLPRLPLDVQNLGVQVRKATPSILLAVHLYSTDKSRDTLYLSNYLTLHVKDALARLQGVGDVRCLGGREYAMRIWLDPDRVAAHDLSASDVLAALRAQNLQVSAGILNQPPAPGGDAYQINVETLGRLSAPEQFAGIVVKSDSEGRVTRIGDIGRVEVGAADYGSTAFVDRDNASSLLIYAEPGANSLAVDGEVLSTMRELKKDFPQGVAYTIVYDPTIFIRKSVDEVIITIFVAILLVVGVVFLFLQTWRATIIPVVAIPVSLIGTFSILSALGISLNNLSLFGLVLAVGIVVDDAIVVVENVERKIRSGMSPPEAAHKTMDEVGGALISIALTLCAVFVPSAFISGISGLFFRQFAVTIAASTVISCFVSLTLSPALCAVLFKPHDAQLVSRAGFARRLLHKGFDRFNRSFEWLSGAYGSLTRRLVRGVAVVLLVYVGLIGLAGVEFARTPTGFIPEQDQGYLITVQLPPGASLERTEKVVKRAIEIILATRGIEHVAPFAGLDATTFTVASNSGTIFSGLPSLYNHSLPGVTANSVLSDLRKRLSVIRDAYVLTIPPPPVQGLGNAGGFKMMLEDRAGLGPEALVKAAKTLVSAANKDPDFAGVFTLFNAGSPSVFADIDRVKAEKVGLTPTDVFSTLQVYLGSQYVNDFNYLGRTYEVVTQADGQFRRTSQDIARLKARNTSGEMVPIGTVAQLKDDTIPYRVPRYNLFPAAEVQGVAASAVASGTALHRMEELAHQVLPKGIAFEWTELAYQQQERGTPTLLVFGAAALFVFLVLVAQYESWKLPLAIVLVVPMCLLASVTGLLARGLPIDILAQIGFVVLVGLAAKNAILIVEFARQKQDHEGATPGEAAVHAARTRLRPILMTSFAFILGVAPLAGATGAGAEMRQSLGTAVLSGMIGVTCFGLLFTPAFYTFIRKLGREERP